MSSQSARETAPAGDCRAVCRLSSELAVTAHCLACTNFWEMPPSPPPRVQPAVRSSKREGRAAIVMSDNRAPWSKSYYAYAVALAAQYARSHSHTLRVYRLAGNGSKRTTACAHPRLGPRAAPWCKLVAVHHTLWLRSSRGEWLHSLVAYVDSDAFWHDTSRSLERLLSDYGGGPSQCAWFASNWPHALADGEAFSIYRAGRSVASTAFFMMRGGANDAARRLVARWWEGTGADSQAFATAPWFEQSGLGLLWPQLSSVSVLNSSTHGLWIHMLPAAHQDARKRSVREAALGATPVVHVDSASDSVRHEQRLKLGAHLAQLCQPACRLLASEDEARELSRSSSWFRLIDVPANVTADLHEGGGPAPGVDAEWFKAGDNQSPPGHWAASTLPTPCCVGTVMEPGRAARCAYHASRAGGGCAGRWRGTSRVGEHCPVACGRCLICRGHPQEHVFEEVRRQWARGARKDQKTQWSPHLASL